MIKLSNILLLAISIFCLSTPFVVHNHQVIYLTTEIIGTIGFINWRHNNPQDKNIIKVFILLILWGLVVSSLSVLPKLSFHGFGIEVLIFALYIGLSKIEFDKRQKSLITLLAVTSILNLAQSLIIFLSAQNALIHHYSELIFGNQVSKVYISTIAIAMIILALFFAKNNLSKVLILSSNFIAGFLLKDMFFLFVFLVTLLYYYLNYLHKISALKILVMTLICTGLLLMLLLYLKIPLHIHNRLLIYVYWLPKLWHSPIYGYGLSLKLLSNYIPAHYPISAELMDLDVNAHLHSHNLFVDTALQQGLIGLTLYLTLPVMLFRQLYKEKVNYQPFLYMCFAILAKNMVDDQFEGARCLIFWFFIFIAYLLSRKPKPLAEELMDKKICAI